MFELHNRALFLVVNSVVYQTHIGIFNYVKWLLEQNNEVKCLSPNTDGGLCSLVCAWDRGEGLGDWKAKGGLRAVQPIRGGNREN
jgi:hypothetical protein